jgi:glycosyltransferase involved in cell wall biosynthesis
VRVLIASSHPHIPQIAGGAQSVAHELALRLSSRGHRVAMLCGLVGTGRLGLRDRLILKLTGRKAVMDRGLGYSVYRSWFAWEAAAEVCRDFRPEVALLQSGHPVCMAKALRPHCAAIVPYFHNVEFDTDLGGDPHEFGQDRRISNSQFTASLYAETFGLDSLVIYPFINPERYRTQTDRSSVLFVNPVPDKGVDVAIALARRLPTIPFLFVEAWTLEPREQARLKSVFAKLRNVTFVSRTSDMRSLYAKARIVLAPSQYDETFGRIAAEAHVSGIPVLATRRGGLPEAVGPGGVLIGPDEPIEAWVAALDRLWNDEAHHKRLSAAALAYSRRPELDMTVQLDRLTGVLQAALEERSSPPIGARHENASIAGGAPCEHASHNIRAS